MKLKKYIPTLVIAGLTAGMTTSCSDMLDKGNDYVMYTGDILDSPADTVTSVIGIINKLQAIGVRNNLLGEVRADLVNVNSNATTDLKNLANIMADVTSDDDENVYNTPRDYYAVINNCNYFLTYADPNAQNNSTGKKYFQYEIAQVHSIRAWTYLQTVLAYGKIPYVTEAITTKQGAEAEYPMLDIAGICDKMIADLQPYYGVQYPDYNDFSGGIDPQLMFFPTQVVMGDLYLWKAVTNHDKESAYQAAKCYYDYIKWDLNGKAKLTTGTGRNYWNANSIKTGKYMNPSSDRESPSSVWGNANCTYITEIPMDSAAADGYYNELRNLYNTTNHTTLKEASISPSDSYKELSANQRYVDYDSNKDTIEVTEDKFEQEQKDKGYVGDLRYQANYSTRDVKYNSQEYKSQSISKHSSQHILVYRASQLYLRLAEALNYAGYPRFARSILTTGLSNTVIENEATRYYPADSARLAYFDFNDNYYKPYFSSYTEKKNNHGVVVNVTPVARSSENEINMWGVHCKGSGLAFLDTAYCKLEIPDSTSYPYTLENEIGNKPLVTDYTWPDKVKAPTERAMPDGWVEYKGVELTKEEWQALETKTSKTYSGYQSAYEKYVTYINDELPAYQAAYAQYQADSIAVANVYNADLDAYNVRYDKFSAAYTQWYKDAYNNVVSTEQATTDDAILKEQALEMVYEGNRYYDLMRRAYWWNDTKKLTEPIAKRSTEAAARLADKKNWFLHYKGQIGY